MTGTIILQNGRIEKRKLHNSFAKKAGTSSAGYGTGGDPRAFPRRSPARSRCGHPKRAFVMNAIYRPHTYLSYYILQP